MWVEIYICAVGVFVVDGHEMLRVVSVSSGFEVPDLPTPPCYIGYPKMGTTPDAMLSIQKTHSLTQR